MPKGRGAQGYAQTANKDAKKNTSTTIAKANYRKEKAKTGAKPKAGNKMSK